MTLTQINWTFVVLIILTVSMLYYNSLVLEPAEKVAVGKKSSVVVRKIVAYSLRKQIELDGEEFLCPEGFENLKANKSYVTEYWSKVDNSELYLTSPVTLDKRLQPFQYLRAVGAIRGGWNVTTYCQILTNDGHVRIIKSTVAAIWYDKWDTNDNNTYYNPVLLSCKLPELEDGLVPIAVSFAPDPCHSPLTTMHRIVQLVDGKETNFTLCVKPLNFQKDISLLLVQWIEICRILGAQFFHIYIQRVTRKTRRVLNWYKTQFPSMFHIEDFKPITDDRCQNCAKSFLQTTWQRRRFEVISYNKCFYQNLNSRFVIPLDIDELIVPKGSKYWKNVVKNLDHRHASLIIQNVYFFQRNKNRKDKPFFLRELQRNLVPSGKGENGKSFISTRTALTVFNHYALHLLRPDVINEYFLPFTDAQLNHYKESCDRVIFPECSEYLSSPTVFDNAVFRYKSEFYSGYNRVIGMMRNENINVF